MKLLGEKYKTYQGARKRAGFENAMAPGEFARGDKAHRYRYDVVQDPNDSAVWRVARTKVEPKLVAP